MLLAAVLCVLPFLRRIAREIVPARSYGQDPRVLQRGRRGGLGLRAWRREQDDGMRFDGDSKIFVERGPHGVARRKALYRKYADQTFSTSG